MSNPLINPETNDCSHTFGLFRNTGMAAAWSMMRKRVVLVFSVCLLLVTLTYLLQGGALPTAVYSPDPQPDPLPDPQPFVIGLPISNTTSTPPAALLQKEILQYLNSFGTHIESATKRLEGRTVSKLQDKGLKVVDANVAGYMEHIRKVNNCEIAEVRAPRGVFTRILSPRIYSVHSNDCHRLQGRTIDYTDVYNLRCIQGPSYEYMETQSNWNLARDYDYHPGIFHPAKFTKWENRSTANRDDAGLGYLHVLKDAYVMSYGDFAVGNNYMQIFRCGRGEHEKVNQNAVQHDKVFSIAEYWGSGFFHFTIEDLPRIALALPFLQNHKDIKVHVHSTNSFTKSFLGELGISGDRLVSGGVRGRTMFIPPGTPCGTAAAIPINLLSIFLRSRFHLEYQKDTIVLIKRSSRRWFGNHDSILKMLESTAKTFNLRVAVFGDKPGPSFETTKSMFNRAIMVVGPHGAGLSNLVFSQPGTCVVEGLCFDGQHRVNLCYKHLAQVLGHIYHGVVPKRQCMQTTAEELLPQINECLKWVK